MASRFGSAVVVIAPNAFKGTLTAAQAATAIREGVLQIWPQAECLELPLADGGDGFMETLLESQRGQVVRCQVSGPMLEPISSGFGWIGSSTEGTAVLELAAACGLILISRPTPETASQATTRGLGELLAAALERQPQRVLIGLGGSASTDGGAGLAQALGFQLLDRSGRQIPPGGRGLLELDRIEPPPGKASWSGVELVAACDVETPLLGPRGAAAVFGPQKGADPEMVERLELGLARLAEVVARDLGVTERESLPGSGAAGGTGFGLICFCGATLTSGFNLVAAMVGLDEALSRADVVITGEGRLDQASLRGKAVGEVLRRAAARGLPPVVLTGSVEPSVRAQLEGQGVLLLTTSAPDGAVAGLTAERALSELRSAAAKACLQLPASGAFPPAG